MAASPKGHILKIQLDKVRPPIWRRVAVPPQLTMGELHDVIQTAMGWYNSHLHSFEVAGREYASPFDEDEFEGINENEARFESVFHRKGMKGKYVYDYGDYWVHTLTYEGKSAEEEEVTHPRVLAGRRACPPEDCGGIWGYANLLEKLTDKEHPEHLQTLEWLGDDFDPEAFDRHEINALLAGDEPSGVGNPP